MAAELLLLLAANGCARPTDAVWRPTNLHGSSDAWTKSVACWVQKVVVGLELCPWAAAAVSGGMRVVVDEGDEGVVLSRIGDELILLAETAGVERATTLIASPRAFETFEGFLEGADAVEAMIKQGGLTGVLQLATFHPKYQFADTEEDDASNWTNRSPVPIFHLLRESEVSRALRAGRIDTEEVWSANIARTRALGRVHMSKLVGGCIPSHLR